MTSATESTSSRMESKATVPANPESPTCSHVTAVDSDFQPRLKLFWYEFGCFRHPGPPGFSDVDGLLGRSHSRSRVSSRSKGLECVPSEPVSSRPPPPEEFDR